MRRLHFLWVALLLGLTACGDTRVAYPLEIVLDDPYAVSAEIDISYAVTDWEGFVVSQGVLATRLPMRHGRVTVIDRAFYAEPGDWIELDVSFSVDGYRMAVRGMVSEVLPHDDGFELAVIYRDRPDDWVVSFIPFTY